MVLRSALSQSGPGDHHRFPERPGRRRADRAAPGQGVPTSFVLRPVLPGQAELSLDAAFQVLLLLAQHQHSVMGYLLAVHPLHKVAYILT